MGTHFSNPKTSRTNFFAYAACAVLAFLTVMVALALFGAFLGCASAPRPIAQPHPAIAVPAPSAAPCLTEPPPSAEGSKLEVVATADSQEQLGDEKIDFFMIAVTQRSWARFIVWVGKMDVWARYAWEKCGEKR